MHWILKVFWIVCKSNGYYLHNSRWKCVQIKIYVGLYFIALYFSVYKLAVFGICIIHWKVSLIVQTLFRIQICLTLKWPYKILSLRVIELCLQIIVTWYTEEGGSCSLFISGFKFLQKKLDMKIKNLSFVNMEITWNLSCVLIWRLKEI